MPQRSYFIFSQNGRQQRLLDFSRQTIIILLVDFLRKAHLQRFSGIRLRAQITLISLRMSLVIQIDQRILCPSLWIPGMSRNTTMPGTLVILPDQYRSLGAILQPQLPCLKRIHIMNLLQHLLVLMTGKPKPDSIPLEHR
jgi:hypothetical protein